MKFITLSFLILVGFTTKLMTQDYTKEWQEVEQLMQKQLPKSAYEKANAIFEKSITANNQEQIVKSIFYLQNLHSQLEEIEYDSRTQKEIKFIETNLDKVKGGAYSLVLSFLAGKYQQYYDQNYWRLSQRTQATDSKSDDLSLWALEDIEAKSLNLYLQSCQDVSNKNISLSTYKNLISNTDSKYCKTLYDFLLRRAINALSNDRHYMNEPVSKFHISENCFVEANQYLKIDFSNKNSDSKKAEVLALYQRLLSEHINDADATILIDIELQRLGFIYNNYYEDDKDEKYITQLDNLFAKYNKNPEVYYALIDKGEIYQNQVSKYTQDKDTSYHWRLKESVAIYNKVIDECKDENIVNQAKNNRNNILNNIHFNTDVEKVTLPLKPILARVEYANMNKLYYRIYKKQIDFDADNVYYRDQKDYFNRILAGKAIHSGSHTIQNLGDYLNHSSELDLPALDKGHYVIVFSRNAEFNFSDNILLANYFSVSNIAYFLHRNNTDDIAELYVVDRMTGHPKPNVKVDYYQWVYNQKRQAKLQKSETTDKNGMVKVNTLNGQNQNYFFHFKAQGDELLETQEEYFYFNSYDNQEHIEHLYQLFLDREIYRPGQTIFFKGIAYQSSNKTRPTILPNKAIEVVFRDVNGQDISKKTFTTNEYGTFNGSFEVPKSGLLGLMSLDVNNGHQKQVRVEEYKRPSFEVIFDTFRQQAKLGDKITVTGTGKAYSGANLPNAKIQYKVMRQTRYPYWRCWWIPMPTEDKQIAFGTTTTDAQGKFDISFIAEEGRKNAWDKYPIYQYEIVAELTDITGETQKGSTDISIGKVDFKIETAIDEIYKSDEKIKFPISIQNLDGQSIDKNYTLKITKLKDPNKLYQKRYWEIPDLPILSEKDFKTKFPDLPYGNEDKVESYKELEDVWQMGKSAQKNQREEQITLESTAWKSGAYKLTISAKTAQGEAISIQRYFTIVNEKELSKDKPISILNLKKTYEPNDAVNIQLGLAQQGQTVWYKLIRNEIPSQPLWATSSSQKIQWSIAEKDRGGAYLMWTTIYNNRLYEGKEFINIPWTNKQLDIEYISFRDKLAPGQQEEWQLKIKGKQGDKVMAEVLANLYDQSLDIFQANHYEFFPYRNLYDNSSIQSHSFYISSLKPHFSQLNLERYKNVKPKLYPELLWQDNYYGGYRGGRLAKRGGIVANEMVAEAAPMATMAAVPQAKGEMKEIAEDASTEESGVKMKGNEKKVEKKETEKPIKIRTNLNETVFFLPNLSTDKEGNVLIKFKMNEALTKWKFMALALTKELQIGISERSVVTQKDLMIQPNAPRFMRENDEVFLTARVTNLSNQKLSGFALLELYNGVNHTSVNYDFGLTNAQNNFDVEAGQTAVVTWRLKVPQGISALTYRVIAKAGNFSDGEENTIPILTDKMLVTETMPFNLKANTTKQFVFKEMQEKITSPTLESKLFKIEYSANPVWYAIQSLPYLMEYPYECTEQLFSRYFANSLSSHIVKRFPKIQSVFEQWKGTDAMLSNLSKNENLKSALLEETPWVMAAQSEEEQRKNIAILFDINRLAQEEKTAIDKLHQRQSADGSYPWFPGGQANPYMTQYVIEGLGHLSFLGVRNYEQDEKAKEILDRGIRFIDNYIVYHYEEMKKWVLKSGGNLKDDHLDPFAIHYLYTRSFFSHSIPSATRAVIDYYRTQGIKYWNHKPLYQQGMLSLYLYRTKETKTTSDMMKSYRERAKVNEEKGMYWDNDYGYYWYELPIETHSLMTEVFEYLSDNQTEKDNLKLFLLKNKQTNRWATTKATAAAIYALLGGKADKLDMPLMPSMKLNDVRVDFAKTEAQAGTGYIEKTWTDKSIQSGFAKLEVTNPNTNIAWGAVYWQYLETMNNIQRNQSTPLKVDKKIFIVTNTDKGEVMNDATVTGIKVGDKVRIRLTLYVEREMEFIHLKDMRGAGFEPVEAISGYRWSGGLGYYQTPRDVSMNFFIDKIYKGTYTIEYDLNANLRGTYSNGIATFQSMYAPEFNSHSKGQAVEVK